MCVCTRGVAATGRPRDDIGPWLQGSADPRCHCLPKSRVLDIDMMVSWLHHLDIRLGLRRVQTPVLPKCPKAAITRVIMGVQP